MTHNDRRHQVGVAADKAVVLYRGAVLMLSVIVHNDRAAAEVDALADVRIAYVRQMRDLGIVVYGRVLYLNKVAYLYRRTDL